MSSQQNNTPATGVFTGLSIKNVKDTKFVNFLIDDAGRQQLRFLCRRAFVAQLLELLEAHIKGEFLFNGERYKAKSLPFDLGIYYENVVKQCELSIETDLAFSESQIQALMIALKAALYYEFKFRFKDSKAGYFICNGNRIDTAYPPLDFALLIDWNLHYFFSLISNR
ncbi:MAG: hypothetical protein JST50_22905 [Bacteroidetes bacterium]|jgi:hypothetical protein|nr:hypothetical protein [Bacteroidota bacterium]